MNVFDLFAKLSLDSSEYEKGLDGAEKKAGGFGEKFGNGLKVIGKATGAALAAGAAGVSVLTKNSVAAYAEYEQLVGGVETLFKSASGQLMGYAENAYKTAGMSANEYMNTVTSFSASLISSLGGDTEKAAQYADMAITDMSDNANKMGTSMEAVQNAYQGFAKQNYTMLDNLKLGYGGTKEEMQRLLDDAEKLSGMKYDISSYADIVDAIHVVQTEMDITGTTSKEAATTIEGSLNTTKAAWQNLVTGFANPDADMNKLMDNLVVALVGENEGEGLLNNVLPAVERALQGVGDFLNKAIPILGKQLPSTLNKVLPSLLQAASQLVSALVAALPQLVKVIGNALPNVVKTLVKSVVDTLPQLLQGIVELFSAISDALPEMVPMLVDAVIDTIISLLENADLLIDAALQLMIGLVNGLVAATPVLIERVPEIIAKFVQAIVESAPLIWNAIVEIFASIVGLIGEYGGKFVEKMGEGLTNLGNKVGQGMSDMLNTFVKWLSELPTTMAYYAGYAIGSFIKFIAELPENVKNIFTNVINRIVSFGTTFVNKAREIAATFFNNLVNGIKSLPSYMVQLGTNLVNAIINLPSKFAEIGKNIVQGIWQGISGGWSWLIDQVKNLANSLFKGAKDALDIHSPSKKFAWIGEMVDKGFAQGLDDYAYLVDNAISSMIDMPTVSVNGNLSTGSGGGFGGYNQTINIYSPTELSPSEVARQTRNETRNMVLAMNM